MRHCNRANKNLEAAGDSVEYGHVSLLDRCDGIVDGERSVFIQQLGIFAVSVLS